ncbi:MAG TPA: ABC transporter ATP-binding protein [Acholeplasmataceae bacterium]|nr:ABC transporter ATP-binding protein [Acholeplasmataceae bacterium]
MRNGIKSFLLLLKKYPYSIINYVLSIITSIVIINIPIIVIERIVYIYDKTRNFDDAIKVVLIASGVGFLCYLITIAINFVNAYIERNFKAELSIMFYEKLNNIDYDFHENPKFLNDYTRALEQGTETIYLSAHNVIETIRIIFQSLSLFIIIFNMHYFAVLYAILIGIIYMFVRIKVGKLDFKALSMQRPFFRQRNYVNRTFFIKDAMADLKTTNISELLLNNNEKANDGIIAIIDKVTSKKAFLLYIGEILISSIYPITLGILAYFTIDNLVLSDFSALTIAATTLSTLVSQLVRVLADLQNNSLECKIPFEVLNMKSKIEGVEYEEVKGDFKELVVDNASFSYDGENLALKNINMKIRKGEKIAIVGLNGAGKTTLVKLLLRLYDVGSGAIYINGQDYRNVTASSLRKIVGAVFQNVEVYAASIAENVLLRKPKNETDLNLINEALKFSGLYDYVYSLEENINTEITREFHKQGAVFSGGQIQRLAIARGYAQNYEVFILDEPSSALDPLAEAEVYKNMLELGKDRTIIFISHRLTTTVNSDYIYLFADGEIVEAGTHEKLINQNGLYKKMFTSQASKYLRSNYENN